MSGILTQDVFTGQVCWTLSIFPKNCVFQHCASYFSQERMLVRLVISIKWHQFYLGALAIDCYYYMDATIPNVSSKTHNSRYEHNFDLIILSKKLWSTASHRCLCRYDVRARRDEKCTAYLFTVYTSCTHLFNISVNLTSFDAIWWRKLFSRLFAHRI